MLRSSQVLQEKNLNDLAADCSTLIGLESGARDMESMSTKNICMTYLLPRVGFETVSRKSAFFDYLTRHPSKPYGDKRKEMCKTGYLATRAIHPIPRDNHGQESVREAPYHEHHWRMK